MSCVKHYLDTITVGEVLEVDLTQSHRLDTFHCAGDQLILRPDVSNAKGSVTYSWRSGGAGDSLVVKLHDSTVSQYVEVVVSDTQGCNARAFVTVYNRLRPAFDTISDQSICLNDTLNLVSGGRWYDPRKTDSSFYIKSYPLYHDWSFNGATVGTDSVLRTFMTGEYMLRVTDSLGCTVQDSFSLNRRRMVIPINRSVCFDSDSIHLKGKEDPRYLGGRWSCITQASMLPDGKAFYPDSAVQSELPKTYQVIYDNWRPTQRCWLVDTFEVTVNALPSFKPEHQSYTFAKTWNDRTLFILCLRASGTHRYGFLGRRLDL